MPAFPASSYLHGTRTGTNSTFYQHATFILDRFWITRGYLISIVSSCHQKCIPKTYIEGDLNKGEAVCIDRCVGKFFEVNKSVGTKLQQMSGAGLPM